ncbi:MAG TPA: DUF3224 domain-containing protein [Solirubrobacterales bacterium]|nr:DUF3224 domain-containing protein [Solirubrobacterales bacterium]
MTANAPFTNDRYEEEPYGDADGAEVSRVQISRTFTGDLQGSSTAELLIAKSEGGGGYVGHDRVRGTLQGRTGGFVFQHTGLMGPEGVTNTGTIVPGTGTGELEGITGEGTMLADEEGDHTLTLEYELG